MKFNIPPTQRAVTVTIDADGHSVIEAHNFKGQGCAAATEELELVLAGSDPGNKDDKKKPDFYATNPQTQNQRI